MNASIGRACVWIFPKGRMLSRGLIGAFRKAFCLVKAKIPAKSKKEILL